MRAIRHVEKAVLDANWTEGIVLRYGAFYGPGTKLPPTARRWSWSAVRSRWSASPAGCGRSSRSPTPLMQRSAALTTPPAGSTTSSTMIPPRSPSGCRRSHIAGAKEPSRVPRLIGRRFAGEAGVVMMTELRGASNDKAKRELVWRPGPPSWRQGFSRCLSAVVVAMESRHERTAQPRQESERGAAETVHNRRCESTDQVDNPLSKPTSGPPPWTPGITARLQWSARWMTSQSASECSPSY